MLIVWKRFIRHWRCSARDKRWSSVGTSDKKVKREINLLALKCTNSHLSKVQVGFVLPSLKGRSSLSVFVVNILWAVWRRDVHPRSRLTFSHVMGGRKRLCKSICSGWGKYGANTQTTGVCDWSRSDVYGEYVIWKSIHQKTPSWCTRAEETDVDQCGE